MLYEIIYLVGMYLYAIQCTLRQSTLPCEVSTYCIPYCHTAFKSKINLKLISNFRKIFLIKIKFISPSPVKQVLLEISQNSQENTCARVSFLINFIKKRDSGTGVFL